MRGVSESAREEDAEGPGNGGQGQNQDGFYSRPPPTTCGHSMQLELDVFVTDRERHGIGPYPPRQ